MKAHEYCLNAPGAQTYLHHCGILGSVHLRLRILFKGLSFGLPGNPKPLSPELVGPFKRGPAFARSAKTCEKRSSVSDRGESRAFGTRGFGSRVSGSRHSGLGFTGVYIGIYRGFAFRYFL